jgi:hypothetical protein
MGAGPAGWQVAKQLREQDLSAHALVELAHELRTVTSATGAALLINEWRWLPSGAVAFGSVFDTRPRRAYRAPKWHPGIAKCLLLVNPGHCARWNRQ